MACRIEARKPLQIEFFYDVTCIWAYFAFEQLRRSAQALELTIGLRPLLVETVFAAVNPAASRKPGPAKQAYYERDLANWAGYLGLPLSKTAVMPPSAADCMIACVAADRWGRGEAFTAAAFAALWRDGRDIGECAVLAEVWSRAGLPDAVLTDALAWPEFRGAIQSNAAAMMDHGGFGVPSFLVGEELFFGNDAIPLVARAAEAARRAEALR